MKNNLLLMLIEINKDSPLPEGPSHTVYWGRAKPENIFWTIFIYFN